MTMQEAINELDDAITEADAALALLAVTHPAHEKVSKSKAAILRARAILVELRGGE